MLLDGISILFRMPDIVPIAEIPQTSLPSVAPSPSSLINLPCIASHDSRNTIATSSPISISLGDIRIEIGSKASDDVITSIIKAVRHA